MQSAHEPFYVYLEHLEHIEAAISMQSAHFEHLEQIETAHAQQRAVPQRHCVSIRLDLIPLEDAHLPIR
jgi:hypothetical protein